MSFENFKNNICKYKKTVFILLLIIVIQLVLILYRLFTGIYKYFFIDELDLLNRYGRDSWVVITGASSGQGSNFALEFAKRKFNILMIGSKRTINTENTIKKLYPNIKTKIIYKNFSEAYKDDFFDNIATEINNLDVSVLINNVGYRVGWKPYHEMPSKYIRDVVSTGTIVQSRLTQLVIPKFIQRKKYNKTSCLLNITAQCMHPNFLFMLSGNEISVPYLSIYEAANAFGFYQGNSIYKEYKDQFDILNITPGAVITENTTCLINTIFNIDSLSFVKNIIKLLGNINGYSCGYWGHALASYLINFAPFIKDSILENVGLTLANNFMKNEENNKNKYAI
jgi:17beta-estradiol 17-dehydrogenase / very-long-chain 3-oxoacyl-CoA reductase